MTWAVEADLLVSEQYGKTIDKTKYLDMAETEMTSFLGEVYELPLPIEGDPGLSPNHLGLLTTIQSKIASARLMMAETSPEGAKKVHAYALHLLEEAYTDLERLTSSIELSGAIRISVVNTEAVVTTPAFYAGRESPYFDAYRMTVYGGTPSFLDLSNGAP